MSIEVGAQVQFATEFALFLVAVAGLALSLLRVDLLTRSQAVRLLLVAAFSALAGAAFVHGSLLAEEATDPAVLVPRGLGWLALLGGVLQWEGGRWSRRLLVVASLLGAAAIGATVGGSEIVAASLRAAAAAAVGAALLNASRRAIAARVAASAAATLLLVVLVLSVGLSAVLSNTVEEQAVNAVDSRAVREASLVEGERNDAIAAAVLTSTGLAQAGETAPTLLAINAAGAATAEQRAALTDVLDELRTAAFLRDTIALAYVDDRAGVVASAGLPASLFEQLLDTGAARAASTRRQSTGDVVAVAGRVVVLGVHAVERDRPLGLVLAAVNIDEGYLEDRARAEDVISLAVWSRDRRLAAFGPQPPARVVQPLAASILAGEPGATERTAARFVASRAIRSQENRPLFAVVASRSTTAIQDIRERLFRTFFVIAFGGTLLALLLAALVGERIGAGVRRLTASAEALERGEQDVRSWVRTEDEVGRLGAAFDLMAASIEEKASALRQAALDEARLRDRLEAVIAGMGEALIAVDESGAVTDFNEAAEDLIGTAADAAKGRAVTDVVRLVNEEGADLSGRLLDGDDRWSDVAEVESVDGDHVPVAITVGPLRGPGGETAGRVLVLRDLRGEREVERMKREFLSRVGHELRTPLTPLLGYARILAGREVAHDRAKEIAESMVVAGQRLERIVEMLEFFASAQAGRTVLRPEVVDVRDLLAEIVTRQQQSMPNGHVLIRRVRTGTPPVVGDRYWLRRSVEELLDNAVKFSPTGGRILVSASPVAGGVEIAVRDSGAGMTDEELARAFAEWSQGDESDTRPYGGLGLGLALVRRVAERHGGRVTCETAPGKGARFSIVLPAVPAPLDEVAAPASDAHSAPR